MERSIKVPVPALKAVVLFANKGGAFGDGLMVTPKWVAAADNAFLGLVRLPAVGEGDPVNLSLDCVKSALALKGDTVEVADGLLKVWNGDKVTGMTSLKLADSKFPSDPLALIRIKEASALRVILDGARLQVVGKAVQTFKSKSGDKLNKVEVSAGESSDKGVYFRSAVEGRGVLQIYLMPVSVSS